MNVLPTGIPMGRFSGGDGLRFRERHGLSAEQPCVLFVGRVAFEKNIDFLIESLSLARREVPNLILLITGEGPAKRALHRQAEALGLSEAVRFIGYLDRRHELPDCYAAADGFVFASRTETQGLVLLEAMAMGLPVVALAARRTMWLRSPQQWSACYVIRPCAAGSRKRRATMPGSGRMIDWRRSWPNATAASLRPRIAPIRAPARRVAAGNLRAACRAHSHASPRRPAQNHFSARRWQVRSPFRRRPRSRQNSQTRSRET